MEPFSIKNTESLENVLYKTSTDTGLQNSEELSSLKKTYTYSAISMVDPLGMHPKVLVHNLYTTSLQMMYILI